MRKHITKAMGSLRQSSHFNKRTALGVAAAVALVGIVAISFSRAATPFASLEPEQGTLTAGATTGSDSQASGGQYVQFGEGPVSSIDHGEDMNASNTGYTAYFDPALGRKLTKEDLTVIDGSIDTTHDGQIIEKAWIKGRIVVKHNNVTIRGIYLDHPPTVLYGITWDSAIRPTGTTIQYCELDGNGDGVFSTKAMFLGNVDVSYCNIHSWGNNNTILGGTAERPSRASYNFAHSIVYVDGGHHASMSVSEQQHVIFYRNNMEGGNSAALSVYCDESHIDGQCANITVEENLFNTDRANYCLRVAAWKGGSPEPYNMKYIGNKFGNKYYETCGSSLPYASRNIPMGVNGNEWRDNTMQATGEVVQ